MKRFARMIYRKLPILRELHRIRDAITDTQLVLAQLHARMVSVQAMQLDLELASHPRYGDPKRLLRHSFQVSSQNSEDGMIWEIFRRIGMTNKIFAKSELATAASATPRFSSRPVGPGSGSMAIRLFCKRSSAARI